MRTVVTIGAWVVIAALAGACGKDPVDGPTGGGGGSTAAQGGGGNGNATGTGAGAEGGGGAGEGAACVLDESSFDACTLQ